MIPEEKKIQYNYLEGMQVFINDIACSNTEYKQYRFPKRKNNRVQKKWRKNKSNYKYATSYFAYKIDNKIFMHSTIFNKIKHKIATI